MSAITGRVVHHVEQGSREWHALRLGIPTASQFHRIITKAKLGPSAQAEGYIDELLAEWVTGHQAGPEVVSGFMERGLTMEDEARGFYSLLTDQDVAQVGMVEGIVGEGLSVGYSPDGLIDRHGALEIKILKFEKHLRLCRLGLDELEAEYRLQLQGCLWTSKRDWIDLLAYNPDGHSPRRRIEREVAVQAALDEHVPAFCERLAAGRAMLLEQGWTPADVEVHDPEPVSEYQAEPNR